MEGRTPEPARTQTFILAGGQGERLQPLTVSRPKPAVSFGGMFRIIDFTLSNCLHSGLGRVALLTQYKSEELHRYVREGWWDLWSSTPSQREPLVCVSPVSGKRYRGTADAVFQNAELLDSDSEFVLVLSGDHIYQMDYRELLRRHVETNADLSIATVEHPIRQASQFGVVEVDATFRVTGFEEKPPNPRSLPNEPSRALVSMGVYAFKKSVLVNTLRALCESGRGSDFGRDIIPALIHSARTYAYDFRNQKQNTSAYWRDIGTVDAYYAASMDLVRKDPLFDPYFNDNSPSIPTRHPTPPHALRARVHSNARVAQSVLSPRVRIEAGAEIDGSVLLPGVRVGKGARIRRAIVEEGVEIPAGLHVGFDLNHDRRHHTVTESGVVVISQTPISSRQTGLSLVFRNATMHAAKRTSVHSVPAIA
ncbi:MAG TPA: sugar phosphate nucleotidyltransferase [Terriglobia bacterium]|nr:sugar phosphate nucleotidyltransferase [Terriglobia bacterium]